MEKTKFHQTVKENSDIVYKTKQRNVGTVMVQEQLRI